MNTRLSALNRLLLDLLFPPRCVGCQEEGPFLCSTCLSQATPLTPPFCVLCGEPTSALSVLCRNCRETPLCIDGIRSAFYYQGVIREAIHKLKYQYLKAVAPPLARLLADYLSRTPLPADVLVPVPLHPRRLRERGYNQAALLAKELGRLTGLPVAEGALRRARSTQAQARAPGREQRRSNVAGAFICRPEAVEEKRVLLVDDVCTTGFTLEACAVALKDAGAATVWGLTVAREV
jgi:ComF family protein